jgi:KaiC/GvpD/RAD55 family RecA-like ATPase
MTKNEYLLKTGISKTYWNDIKKSDVSFQPAKLCIGNDPVKEISWLDELFRGGIKIFKDMPTTMLVKGPPGSGKTTFVLELCHKLATRKKEPLKSLYISIDSESEQIIRNAKDFGWEQTSEEHCINVLDEKTNNLPHISVWGSEKIENWEKMSQVVDSAFLSLTNWFKIKLSKELQNDINAKKVKSIVNYGIDPDILVVDSLNIIPIDERGKAFQHFLKVARENKNMKLVIFMLDGRSSSNLNPFWEYLSDIVIELNYHEYSEYYTRTIEIVKSRFQEHVWGKHQLKIYSKFSFPDENDEEFENKLLRSHPYRSEGGIFIFPSIHYYLSKYKRVAQKENPNYDITFPKSLNDFLSNSYREKELKGLPKGRCTAFIGSRGGHKSHLGYLHILSRLTKSYLKIDESTKKDKRQESALIISLRDDEKMTENTLSRILENEFPNSEVDIDNLKKEGYLEILYYPPGYISPEEFIHRIFISIHKLKLKAGNGHVTVLFNSLDQLAARFPLCSQQKIFIPSIIQVLIGEEITSIFIAVDEKDQPVEQYGLLPMADLILSFHKYKLSSSTYLDILRSDIGRNYLIEPDNNESMDTREEIILTVERFAGGKKAGSKGLLELGNPFLEDGDNNPNQMNFIELKQDFDFYNIEKIERLD